MFPTRPSALRYCCRAVTTAFWISAAAASLHVGRAIAIEPSVSERSFGDRTTDSLTIDSRLAAEPQLAAARRLLNEQYAATVILPTYRTLNTQAETLADASEQFWRSPTNTHYSNLQSAWLAVASTWAKSEAFAFGPVHSLGHSSALGFPADPLAIDTLIAAEPLTSAVSLSDLEAVALHPSLQGLEAIAYLLSSRSADEATTRPETKFTTVERLYLHYLATAVHASTTDLLLVWQDGWNGQAPYAQALATAGEPNNIFYQSPYAATEEIVRTLFNTLDVVTLEVLPEQIASLEEDAVAIDLVSLQLIISSVEGIQNAYTGGTHAADSESVSLSSAVAISQPAADQQITDDFAIALAQLDQTLNKSTNPDASVESSIESLGAALSALTSAQTHIEESAFSLFQN